MPVNYCPEGYHSVTPYLFVAGAAQALDFYAKALGATELYRLAGQDGRVAHAEIEIGDSRLMLADENPEMGVKGPRTIGGVASSLMIYVEDVDSAFARAVQAGAKPLRPVQDQFYGDRSGSFEDPFGHHWSLSTHKEDVSPEEVSRRYEDMMKRSHGS
jgi:PhnB protein